MAVNKFKVGDKVRVKAGLTTTEYGDIYCNEEMVNMAGNILTISDFVSDDTYAVQENDWYWKDEMLEFVAQSELTPEIADYKYNSETGETWIKWVDKTETRVRPESGTEPNQFVGFVTAYAKKAAGNTSRINSLFDKWAIKKPIQDKKVEEKRVTEETETKRIIEKRKKKREKWLIRKEALRIKREYEARKIAHEKYGVPMCETTNYESKL